MHSLDGGKDLLTGVNITADSAFHSKAVIAAVAAIGADAYVAIATIADVALADAVRHKERRRACAQPQTGARGGRRRQPDYSHAPGQLPRCSFQGASHCVRRLPRARGLSSPSGGHTPAVADGHQLFALVHNIQKIARGRWLG